MLDLKFTQPKEAENFIVSKDKNKLVIFKKNEVNIRCVSTLQIIRTIKDSLFSQLTFSQDSKYLSYLSDFCLKIIDIDSDDLLEIQLKTNVKICKIIWNPSSQIVVYISELEIYIGIYDMNIHRNFTIQGCSFNDFEEPFCDFSPNEDYLCYLKNQHCFVYSCENWELVLKIKCVVNPSNFIFISPYVVCITTNDGEINDYSILSGGKVNSENYLPDECIKKIGVSNNGLMAAMASYSDFFVIKETISFHKVCHINYKYKIRICDKADIWEEQNAEIMSKKCLLSVDNFIEIKVLKNINDEFKVKTNNKYLISFSCDDDYIASYNPGAKNVVWIWNWIGKFPLKAIILLKETLVEKLIWHEGVNVLAIVCQDKVVFWHESDNCSIVKCESVKFDWVHKHKTVGAIGNDSLVQMVIVDVR